MQSPLRSACRKICYSQAMPWLHCSGPTQLATAPGTQWLNLITLALDSASLMQDFLRMLPWPEYTHPQGPLNLASHLLQDLDNPPDLGPKSYVAYGRCSLCSRRLCLAVSMCDT